MAKLGWPKGGFDTFSCNEALVIFHIQSSSFTESLERLQDFPREPGGPSGLLGWNWGEQGCSCSC